MKDMRTWFTASCALLMTCVAFQQTHAFHKEKEARLEMANTRIHERLFVELLKSELKHELPAITPTVSPSGGVSKMAGTVGFTTTNDIYFDQSVSMDQLERVVLNLSTNKEIAAWRSTAAETDASRVCRFLLLEKSGRPYIRMLMYESSEKAISEADLVQVFSGNYLLTAN